MRQECPGKIVIYNCKGEKQERTCGRELKPRGTRWLFGRSADRYATAHSKLVKFECCGRGGCGHNFMVKTDIPLHEYLEQKTSLFYDWAAWNTAEKDKPGTEQIGTTMSEYTRRCARDPAAVFAQILNPKLPPFADERKSRFALI